MAKKLHSFRMDEDLLGLSKKYHKKNKDIKLTDVVNAALYQFLAAPEKKQKKYLKKYKIREFNAGAKSAGKDVIIDENLED